MVRRVAKRNNINVAIAPCLLDNVRNPGIGRAILDLPHAPSLWGCPLKLYQNSLGELAWLFH